MRSSYRTLCSVSKVFRWAGVSMSEKVKTFVLDTSVIIHDPEAVYQFGEHNIVVPLAVISEVDGFKTGNDQKGYNAREFSRFLDQLKEEHKTLTELVPVPEPATGMICLSAANGYLKQLPPELDERNKDRQIIATALKWKKEHPDHHTVLVSKDTNVRLLGHACGIVTEDYKRGQIRDYTGLVDEPETIPVEDHLIDLLMKEQLVPSDHFPALTKSLRPNNCITLVGQGEPGKSALVVVESFSGQLYLRRLLKEDHRIWGLMPRNREQTFAASLLLNDQLRLVSLIGKAGTGKTLLALAAGLEQTYEVPARRYKKIVVMRPVVPVGKDIGWLPGDLSDKIAPWMKPIYDNIAFLMGEEGEKNRDYRNNGSNNSRVQQLFDQGIIEVEVMSFVRGRSINDAFIIIDEAQNLTPHEIKTVLTRAAGRSKIVLTGDLDQIDTPYLDAHSSGLTHVVKKFMGHPIAGYTRLIKGERSALAELAADVL